MFGLISQAVRRDCGKPVGPSNLHSNEAGATAVEYSLLLAFIAAAIIATVTLVGPALQPGFQAVIDGL